ncbi:hypothetical protein TorRG33x02_003560 [Trema orientale]|uniref:Transmembrane protein n=1 Tax=Trema orientale TaxID=63057 RepID=A0A2P5G1Z8_TREOI|nr:hypothetical protein TorRG33x02_003560 [Trema orientale]
MATENNNNDNLRERKGKAAVEADHDDDHHGHIDLDEVLNEAAHLEAQLALSNLDVTLSELPSTSRAQPAVSLLPDLLNNKSDNDDDILEVITLVASLLTIFLYVYLSINASCN